MHCPWCANPEGIPLQAPLMVDSKNLIAGICPHGAIKNKSLDRKICETCKDRKCLGINRSQGISIKAKSQDIVQIWQQIESSRSLFFEGGGITLTGGEPTLQFEAVKALLSKCKDNHINTVIETNGTNPRLPELYPLIDHLIMDVKHGNSQKLKLITGQSLTHIRANLEKAMEQNKDILIRIPIINNSTFPHGKRNMNLEK